MLRCDTVDDPVVVVVDLLTGRTAPESSDRLVLTAEVVVVAGPDEPRLLLLGFRLLNHPKQPIFRRTPHRKLPHPLHVLR